MKTESKKMTTIQIFYFVLFLVLALLFALYGFAIFSIHSGSRFYLVWFGLCGLSALLAVFTKFGLFGKISMPVRIIALSILGICLLVFLYTQVRIMTHFRDTAPDNLDYVIVLGAQMRPDGPSVVLRYRLDNAYEYLKNNPDTVCIVSGGKGPNETEPEAYGMRDYLISKGIDASKIITEDKSGNTIQNILYSKELMSSPDASVGIVTNNFHVYRGTALAKKQGLTNVHGISARSSYGYLPNNMLREFVGILKDSLLGNMYFF